MIYVIEEDNNVRNSLEVLISSYDLACKSYLRGEDFMKEYLRGSDDLMILNMRADHYDAREFLMVLKEAGITLPIIGLTSHDEPEIRTFCQIYGVKSLLNKPVDSNALIDLIKYHSKVEIYKLHLTNMNRNIHNI